MARDTTELLEKMGQATDDAAEDDLPLDVMIYNLNRSISWGLMAVVMELRNVRDQIAELNQ